MKKDAKVKKGPKFKAFFKRLVEKLDKKMEEKAKSKPCCCSSSNKGKDSCCG